MRLHMRTILLVLSMTSVTATYLLLRPVPSAQHSLRLTTTNASVRQTDNLLAHVLVGISFHFNRQKLAYLKYVSML